MICIICGFLCTCCMAEIGFPPGTYQISEKGQANAEIMRDTAMFYHYHFKGKKKEAAALLEKVLEHKNNAPFLLYTCSSMYNSGSFPEEKFIALARKHPDNPQLCYIFAESLNAKGKKEVALEILEKALAYRLDPPAEQEEPRGKKEKWMSGDFQSLVRVYLDFLERDGQYQKGGDFLQKLFKVYSHEKLNEVTLLGLYAFVNKGMGLVHKEFFRQEAKRCISMLKKSMEGPNEFSTRISLRTAYMFLSAGENDLLDALLTEPLVTNPAASTSYESLAMLFYIKGQGQNQLRALSQEVFYGSLGKKFPKDSLRHLFSAALDWKDKKTVFKNLGRIQLMGLMDDELYHKFVLFLIEENDLLRAKSYCSQIKNPVIRDTLTGGILEREKKYREAMEIFMRLERNDPENVFLKMSIAEIAKKCGDREIENQFRKEMILKINQFPEFQNYIGYTWAEQGINLDLAEKYLSMALKQDPRNYAYLDSMAWVLYKKKNYSKAKEFILLALRYCKTVNVRGVLLDHAGDIFAALGDRKQALRCWQQAVQTEDPELDVKQVLKKLPRPFEYEVRKVQNQESKADDQKTVPSESQKSEH